MSESNVWVHMVEAASYVRDKSTIKKPEVGLILGSGLGVLADALEESVSIAYRDIPHFPLSTVEGHAGELLLGRVKGTPVVMMKGRFHPYEGYPPATVSFPVRVMKALGAHSLLVTNAAGGVNTSFRPGDLMVIRDHLNLMYRNPLTGPNDTRLGVRFPDMSEAYSNSSRRIAAETADRLGISLQEGVYAGLLGPNYETPAEIRMLGQLGADAVGMSTVPEVIAARHSGMNVLGISCITNMAAGLQEQPLSHDEVMETAERVKQTFLQLVTEIVPQLHA